MRNALAAPPEWFFERNFAPEISWFQGADLPDLSDAHPEQRYWLKNFLLNQLTHVVPDGKRELVFAQLRRAHASFAAYETLRSSLKEYGRKPRSVSTYMVLLDCAEIWLTFTAQAFEIANALHVIDNINREFKFASLEELNRLHKLYIASKHVPGMVSGKEFRFPDPVVLWFNPEGIKARRRGLVRFGSFPSVMRQLAMEAESFASYIPTAR